MRWKRVGQWGCRLPTTHPGPRLTPLLVELQQLLCHLGSVESQAQAVDVELRDDVSPGRPEGQAPPVRASWRWVWHPPGWSPARW